MFSIPVVHVDGKQVCEHKVNEAQVLERLSSATTE